MVLAAAAAAGGGNSSRGMQTLLVQSSVALRVLADIGCSQPVAGAVLLWLAFYSCQSSPPPPPPGGGQLAVALPDRARACLKVAHRYLRRSPAAAADASPPSPPPPLPPKPAPVTSPRLAALRPRSSRVVGAVPCCFPDDPPYPSTSSTLHIPIRSFPTVPATMKPWTVPRSSSYTPPDRQAAAQRLRMQSWGMRRLLTSGRLDIVFAFGSVAKLVRQWRARVRPPSGRSPPLYLLRRACSSTALHTPGVSASLHLWSVLHEAPLDAVQYCQVLASPSASSSLHSLVLGGSISQYTMRCVCGQATHGGVIRLVVLRLVALASAVHTWPSAPSVMLVGAGAGFTGLQCVAALGPSSFVMGAIDACPRARAVGQLLLAARGHDPTWFSRAEAAALATPMWAATLEAVTLRCAPFSIANPLAPRGQEGALHELAAVCRGIAARSPLTILFETTSGLWRDASLRLRLEQILQDTLPAYVWEGAILSPHLHAGSKWRRVRVFYYAYLRSPRA